MQLLADNCNPFDEFFCEIYYFPAISNHSQQIFRSNLHPVSRLLSEYDLVPKYENGGSGKKVCDQFIIK